jgi:hypothetical protein
MLAPRFAGELPRDEFEAPLAHQQSNQDDLSRSDPHLCTSDLCFTQDHHFEDHSAVLNAFEAQQQSQLEDSTNAAGLTTPLCNGKEEKISQSFENPQSTI